MIKYNQDTQQSQDAAALAVVRSALLSEFKTEIEAFSKHLRETADAYYRGDDRDYDHGGTVDLIKDDFDSWFSEFLNR